MEQDTANAILRQAAQAVNVSPGYVRPDFTSELRRVEMLILAYA